MKAISLWQPWASAVALGAKTFETRSWPTTHRGPLAIHASKRCIKREMIHHQCSKPFQGVFKSDLKGSKNLWEVLPFGCIIAVVDMVDCIPTYEMTLGVLDTVRFPEDIDLRYAHLSEMYGYTERMMGDYSIGRFAWRFENARRLDPPIPFTGRQGFFNVPDELVNAYLPN